MNVERLSAERLGRPVPPRALALSVAALVVPALAMLFRPGLAEQDFGLLVWVTAVVPAFLLAYYRGLRGVAVALAAGMAALSVTQAVVASLGWANPDWALVLVAVTLYLGICIAIAIFAELMHRERRAAEAMALLDPLTGLPNRRYAERTLAQEFAAARRGRKVSVITYDLDYFKMFNDTYGHAAGDEVLRLFGEVLARCTRRQDMSARYGGEEFISIVTDADLDQTLRVAERVREDIRSQKTPWGRVTVSVGIATFREGMGSYQILVAAADRALYVAKEGGRDRVEVARERERRRSSAAMTRISPASRRRRVLVVSNDEALRRHLASVLDRSGFRVEKTGSPEDAIERFRNNRTPVDLLVTSVMMARVNGFTLVDRIREIEPDLRVVYISNEMEEGVSWPGAPGMVAKFVPVPVDPAHLLATAREALDESVEADDAPDDRVATPQTRPKRHTGARRFSAE